MRNFSAISVANFASHTINGGEYVQNVDTLAVVRSLAGLFETPLSQVLTGWNEVLREERFSSILCSSEYEVLQKLYEFARFVDLSIRNDGKDTTSQVFAYYNLNTGWSCVWSHSVS